MVLQIKTYRAYLIGNRTRERRKKGDFFTDLARQLTSAYVCYICKTRQQVKMQYVQISNITDSVGVSAKVLRSKID